MATITLVQDADAGITSSATISPDLASAITEGNLVIANVMTKNFTGLTNPSGFTTAITMDNATEEDRGRIAFKIAGAAEPDPSWTAGGADQICASTSEWNSDVGWNPSPLDDTASTGRTSGESISSGTSDALPQSDGLAIAALFARFTAVTGDFGAFPGLTNGFTAINWIPSTTESGSTCQIADAYKVITDGAAQETTFSWTGETVVMAAIATFLPVSEGGGGASTILPLLNAYYA